MLVKLLQQLNLSYTLCVQEDYFKSVCACGVCKALLISLCIYVACQCERQFISFALLCCVGAICAYIVTNIYQREY